eukprot:3941729-Rhodomonas_salina.5
MPLLRGTDNVLCCFCLVLITCDAATREDDEGPWVVPPTRSSMCYGAMLLLCAVYTSVLTYGQLLCFRYTPKSSTRDRNSVQLVPGMRFLVFDFGVYAVSGTDLGYAATRTRSMGRRKATGRRYTLDPRP